MKRMLLSCLMLIFGMVAFADNLKSVVDSSDNVLSLKVQETNDLKRIPLEVTMTNPSVPMTCVQCYLQVSDSLAAFCKDDDGKTYICSRTTRWTKQHQAILSWNPKNHKSSLMALIVSPMSENFNGTMGPVLITYFDGSKLADGDYTVKMFDANMVWTDKRNIRTYLTPDREVRFSISAGKLKVQP